MISAVRFQAGTTLHAHHPVDKPALKPLTSNTNPESNKVDTSKRRVSKKSWITGVLLAGMALLSGCRSSTNPNAITADSPSPKPAVTTLANEKAPIVAESGDANSRVGQLGISTSGKPGINLGGGVMMDFEGNIGFDLMGP